VFGASIAELQAKLGKGSQSSSQLTPEVVNDKRECRIKLRAVLRKLKQGDHVQNRQLKAWLT